MKRKRNLRYDRTKMFMYYLTYKASILVHTSKACIYAVVTVRSRRSHNGGTQPNELERINNINRFNRKLDRSYISEHDGFYKLLFNLPCQFICYCMRNHVSRLNLTHFKVPKEFIWKIQYSEKKKYLETGNGAGGSQSTSKKSQTGCIWTCLICLVYSGVE